MQKGYFCDEVLRSLTSGNYNVSEFKFERRDVAAHINGGIAAFVKANFFENYNLGDKGWIDAGFTTTYESVPVIYSSDRDLYYSELPTLPISLERGLGIVQVSPMKNESDAFIPLGMATSGLYKGLAAENLFGLPAFRQQGKRIYYKNVVQGHPATIDGVLIVMIADTLAFSMEDELPMPADYFIQVRDIVIKNMVGSLSIPQDTTIDSNKNK